MKLNANQKRAVETLDQNLLVSAGAGTGKTRVLVERFINLVTKQSALVTEVLTLTFTDKAAAEMKGRILDRFKELGMEKSRRDLESAYISTIHAFASRVLKEHPLEAGVDPDFGVMQEEEADLLKHQVLDQVIEAACLSGDGTFELLKIYGENEIREGILKIHRAARVKGAVLEQFFNDSRERVKQFLPGSAYDRENQSQIDGLLGQLNEKELAAEWKAFAKAAWDASVKSDFSEWYKPFSRKGGKETKALWKELSERCKIHLAIQREVLIQPLRVIFEKNALAFEFLYENSKQTEARLDFEDLEIKVLGLFTRDHPANRKIVSRYRKHFKYIMVDEFQDTNPLQSRILEALSDKANLFFVGDYKQSIYGFRGASPEAFKKREAECRGAKSKNLIHLDENFRSHESILDFVNDFFAAIWEEDGFSFEKLTVGSEAEHQAPGVELLLTTVEDGESLDRARMREANLIAARLSELHESGKPWGEMAILFEATSAAAIYEQALKSAGIPYYVVSGRGFYHQPEIRDIMSFLGCLENPMSDIDLAAALRSPLFQISNDALFWLARKAKEKDENTPFYYGVKEFETIEQISDEQKIKIRFFTEVFDKLRGEKDRLRLVELLDRILEETAYELSVLADSEGARRYANLKKLLELAREHEARQIVPLGNFMTTIRGFEMREIREAEAQTETERGGRAVRLMTVHKAKGLEFSVVVLADLAHRSQSRESKVFAAEPEWGYAFKVLEAPGDEDYTVPVSWKLISETIEKRETEEWKRLFYVAMTRAKTCLILSGAYKPKKEAKNNFSDMGTWMEWVMALKDEMKELKVIENNKDYSAKGRAKMAPVETKAFLNILEDPSGELLPDPVHSKTQIKAIREKADALLEQIQGIAVPGPKSLDLPVSAYALFQKDPMEWQRVYQFGYPGGYALELAGKEMDYKPKETQKPDPWEDISPADFGTAMHALLENIDFAHPLNNLEEKLARSFRGMEGHRVDQAKKMASDFFKSAAFKRIQGAKKIYRELPFILSERHGKIQGVIDLLFQDANGHWVILDYKTGEGTPQKVKSEGYELQIQVYALAVSKILGVSPSAGILYFFKNQWAHETLLTPETVEQCRKEVLGFQDEMIRRSCENLSKMV